MEAKSSDTIPEDGPYLYEPKWDGFRCLAFRSGDKILLQSKAGQPLGRYFPELVAALAQLKARKFVLDGESSSSSSSEIAFRLTICLCGFIPPNREFANYQLRPQRR